ncbi:MAG: hypothetical protein ACOYOT_07630 [Bacteroidales bacterium]
MLKNKIEKSLYNPAIGLFPLLLVIFLLPYIPLHQVIDFGLMTGTMMVLVFVWFTGKRVFQSFLLTSMLTLLLFNCLFTIFKAEDLQKHAFIILEFLFVVIVGIIKFYEDRIHRFIDTNLKVGIKIHLKPALQMFFFVSKLFIYCAPFHLFMLLIFSFLPSATLHAGFLVVFKALFPSMILVIGAFELFNIRWIGSEISRERYLPIVDTNSRVIGHMALSESLSFEKKFLHPVVRIVCKQGNRLFLRARPETSHYEVGKMCLPIEDYVNYGENIEDAAKRILQNAVGRTKLVPRFMLKYNHEHEGRRCIFYLFMVNIEAEKEFHPKNLQGGKWWTEQQIVDNCDKSFFSSSFESEFEYLQSTVLMADHYGIPVGLYSPKKG